MKSTFLLFSFLFSIVSALAADLRVATLNAYLLFDPSIEHRGKVDEEKPLTPENYLRKVENLVSLMKGYEFIALQETGGRAEIEALAKKGGYQWAFSQGKDTYTGQECGALFNLKEWKVTVNGRVGALDALVSKHLLVTAAKGTETVRFLVVHLIRPIGANAEKHEKQLAGISEWVKAELAKDPKVSIVVLGDFNNSKKISGQSLLGVGSEAGSLIDYSPTHLAGKPFDRMIAAGGARWTSAIVVKPPYGPKPNDLNKSLWTDHFLLGGVLTTN